MRCADTVWVRSPTQQPPDETNSTLQLPIWLHLDVTLSLHITPRGNFSLPTSHFSFWGVAASSPAKILLNAGQKWKSRAKQPFFLPVLSGHPSCSRYCRLVPKVFLLPPRDHHASLSLLPLTFPSPHTWLCFPSAGFLAFYHSPPNVGCWSTPQSANHNPSYQITTKDLQPHAPARASPSAPCTLFSCLQHLQAHAHFGFQRKPVWPWHQHCSEACQHSLH